MADLNEAVEKLKQMMSTEDGQAQLQGIISAFTGGGGNSVDVPQTADDAGRGDPGAAPANNEVSNAPMPDLSKIAGMLGGGMGGTGASGGGNAARHAAVLQSIKPYLSDGRKQKIDTAAKLMSFAKMAAIFKSSE